MTNESNAKRPRGSGSIFVMSGRFEQRGPDEILWIRYCQNGKVFRESSHSTRIRDAEKLLKSRLADVEKNTFIQPADRRLLVDDLYADLIAEYQNNGMASLEGCRQRWEYKGNRGRLRKFFGGVRAVNVDKTMLNRYVADCREQGYRTPQSTVIWLHCVVRCISLLKLKLLLKFRNFRT